MFEAETRLNKNVVDSETRPWKSGVENYNTSLWTMRKPELMLVQLAESNWTIFKGNAKGV